MRMCSTLAVISCNAALRGRREGGGWERYLCGEGIRHSREHGRRRERGEGVELKMIDGFFRCHVCHATLSEHGPHLPYTHTHNVHMHIYTPLQCHPHCGSEEADPVVVLLP